MRIGEFDYTAGAFRVESSSTFSNDTHSMQLTHFSTFGLFNYIAPSPADNSAWYVVALVTVILGFALLVILGVHFLVDKRHAKTSNMYLQDLDEQIKQQRNINLDSFFKNDSKIINVEEVEPHAGARRLSNEDMLKLPPVLTAEPRTLLPYLTKVYWHLGLLRKYSFCRFWVMNILYLTPFLSACCRYHPNVSRKCEVSVDLSRVLVLFCCGIMIASAVEDTHQVYAYCLVLGAFLMSTVVTQLFYLCSTIKLRGESMSIHKIAQYLLVKLPSDKDLGHSRARTYEELEELRIQAYDWAPRRFTFLGFSIIVTVFACVVLGLFALSMYYAK